MPNENVCSIIFKAMNGFVSKESEKVETKLKKCPFCGGQAIMHDCAELDNEKVAAIYSGKVAPADCWMRYFTLKYKEREEAKNV